MLNTTYYTKNKYDFKRVYEFVGFGIDARPIYAIYETKFNISNGVQYLNKFIGHCTDDYKPYSSFIR